MKTQLQKAIAKALKKTTGLNIKPENILLEHPENEEFGDLSTNIALVLAKKLKKNPRDLAKLIVNELKNNLTIQQFSNLAIAGPGFINFTFNKDFFIKELLKVLKEKNKYGHSTSLKNKKIMVEYAHPNTHKSFHIGHLRNITNGEALARVLESQTAKIVRANYQGDVGLHIAKCLWSICKICKSRGYVNPRDLHGKIEFLSKAYVKGNKAFEEDKQAKKEILKINKKIYDKSDKKINKLWQETRQWSLDYFSRIYKRVYTHFDRLYFESETALAGKEIVLKALKKGIFKRSKGAIIFPGKKQGLHDRVFITKEGNPTYEAKDMELCRLQFSEYNPDLIIHNVGPEQASFFKVVFEAQAQVFPKTRGRKYHHISGWVRLKKGKMASRLGNVVLGEWLLDEAKKRLKKAFPKVDDKTAEQIAVAAVKYSFLKVGASKDLVFDFKESISLSGNSGPYLQYTYARCQSVLTRSRSVLKNPDPGAGKYQANKEELVILRHLYKFPEVVEQAAKEYSPNIICNFLYELAQKYNGFYNKHRILLTPGVDKETPGVEANNFRLALTAATAQIIKNGLYLLAIKTPKKM